MTTATNSAIEATVRSSPREIDLIGRSKVCHATPRGTVAHRRWRSFKHVGAILGDIRGGLPWSPVDVGGVGSREYQPFTTAVDTPGHRLEIYGSEGWAFKSSRAR
jgi:hypothetical protein